MADPLSPATRATKRNLLLASVLAISANAFNVSIDKIPVGGLSITFDDRLFAFLLLIVLIYFLCTFVLYYTIDIKNLRETGHQTATEAQYNARINEFELRYANEVVRPELQKLVMGEFSIGPGFPPTLRTGNWDPQAMQILERRQEANTVKTVITTLQVRPDVFKKLNEHSPYWKVQYIKADRANRRKAAFARQLVRMIYFARNYFFDGALPIVLGVFALVAILGHLNLAWIQNYLPSFKALSSSSFDAPG